MSQQEQRGNNNKNVAERARTVSVCFFFEFNSPVCSPLTISPVYKKEKNKAQITLKHILKASTRCGLG